MKQGQILVSLVLLAILFYINIPLSEEELSKLSIDQKQSVDNTLSSQNLSPYNISVLEETNITDATGKVIGSITQEYNKTITPELPEEEKSFQGGLMGIGASIWPSNKIGGLIFLAVVLYVIVWPILRWIKDFIFT